jgi:hypothetical protein
MPILEDFKNTSLAPGFESKKLMMEACTNEAKLL